MANMLGLGVFGTFGQPNGFQQAFNADCHYNFSLDLDSDEIELFPGTELFAVRREIVKGIYSVSFCLYTFVREMNANRNTTFLGSCIVLQGVYIDPEKIYKLLRELHTDLVNDQHNVNNNTIQVRKVTDLSVTEPAQFQSIRFAAQSLEDTPYYSTKVDTRKKFFVKTEHIESASQVVLFFDEALKNYNDTDSLYFTFSDKVISAVTRKDKLNAITWDEFVEHKNLIKEDFITTKQGLKTGAPDIMQAPEAAPVQDSYMPTEQPVAPSMPKRVDPPQAPVASAPALEPVIPLSPPPAPKPAPQSSPIPVPPPLPQVKKEPVTNNVDFPFDEWEDPMSCWDADEVTRRLNEYNRLLAFAKKIKARNDDLIEQKQKDIERIANEAKTVNEYTPQPQRQPFPVEIPLNHPNEDDEEIAQPFYKKQSFLFIVFGVLVIIGIVGSLLYKRHMTKKYETENAASQPADTTRPAVQAPAKPVDSSTSQQ